MADTRPDTYHNLAVMLEAGLPVLRALRTASQGMSGRVPAALRAVADEAAQGGGLAETMARHPQAFDRMDVLLVGVAETSGNLPEAMQMLSRWHGFRRRLRQTVTSGLALPALLLHALAFLGPLPAAIMGRLTAAGYLLEAAWTLLVFYIPAAAIWAVVRYSPSRGPLRRALDGLVLRIPLLRAAVRQLALSRFCHAFHMLHKAGVPMARSVEQAADACGNAVVADWFRGGAEATSQGRPASEGFDRRLPIEFLDAWRIGEESGRMEQVVLRLADAAAESAQRTCTEISHWVPRVIYLAVVILMAVRVVGSFQMLM